MKIRLRPDARHGLAGQSASRLLESGAFQALSVPGRRDLARLSKAACSPFRLAPPAGRRTRCLAPRAFAAWVPLRYAVGHSHGSAFGVALHNLSFERTAFGVRSLSR